jgi:hypothetical protein
LFPSLLARLQVLANKTLYDFTGRRLLLKRLYVAAANFKNGFGEVSYPVHPAGVRRAWLPDRLGLPPIVLLFLTFGFSTVGFS